MKNCCDYDAIIHYEPGAFSRHYKTDLKGKLLETTLDRSLCKDDIDSFKEGYYRTFRTVAPIVLYRLYGMYKKSEGLATDDNALGARLRGRFASTEFAESRIDAKMRLALHPKWFNTKMHEVKLVVPVGITVSIGVVAPVTLATGAVLPGGADQVFLPKDWPEEWIQGYRRVSSRQLQIPPTYWSEKPDMFVTKERKPGSGICPLCCYPNTRSLAAEEQFMIVGRSGRQYTMSQKCLNPACEYYW